MKMRKVILLMSMLTFVVGSVFSQTNYDTISATYTGGVIETDLNFQSPDSTSSCPGVLSILIPAGSIITSVDVEYTMTTGNGAVFYEQMSELRCTSPNGTNEGDVHQISDWNQGTWAHSRTGLTIANGVIPHPIFPVTFELHAGRTEDGIGCDTSFQKVDAGSWTVTVIYLAPGSPGFPTNPSPMDMAQLVDVNTDLTWDFGVNTDNYDLYLGTDNPPTTLAVDNEATLGASSGSYTPTLDYATNYYWYVVAKNSQNELASPVWSFATGCEPEAFPRAEGFDAVTTPDLPPCWIFATDSENASANTQPGNWQVAAHSDPNFLFLDGAGESDPEVIVVLPHVGNVADHMVSLWGKNYYNAWFGSFYQVEVEIGTITDPFDYNSYTTFASYTPDFENWELFEVFMTTYDGDDEYIALRANVSQYESYVYLDDVTVDETPSCIKPLDVVADTIQANEVTLSWADLSTPAQYNVEYGYTGFTPGTGTTVVVGTNPGTVSGLEDATDYDFYVQADCGGGDLSAWSQPITLRTACLPYATPIFEDFGPWQDYSTPYEWPLCWEQIEINSAQYGGMGHTAGPDSLSGAYVWMQPENDIASQLIVISPVIAPAINSLYVNFWLRADSVEMIVGTITVYTDYTTFTPYDTVTAEGDIWDYHTVYMNDYAGTDTRIAIRHNSEIFNYGSILLDEITIDAIPACVEPYKPYVDGITQTTAMYSFTDLLVTATDWIIEVGLQGFTPGTGNEVLLIPYNNATPTGMESVALTTLLPGTTYDVYVRTDCGGGSLSAWSVPNTFLTLFDAFGGIPVTEDFETGFGKTVNDPANKEPWTINTDLQHSGLNSVHNNIVQDASNTLYVGGTFDLTAKADAMLSFWQIAKTNGTYHQCFVEISTDGGMTWDFLPESTYRGSGWYRVEGMYYATGPAFDEDSYADWGTGTETPDNTWWRKEYFDLTDYTAYTEVAFRFRQLWTWGSDYTFKAGWFIDDVAIETLGAPAFYADPLSLSATITPTMPDTLALAMGNTGTLPTSYTASVVYDEVDLINEDFNLGIPVGPGEWTIIHNGNDVVTWADTAGKYGNQNFDGTRMVWADGYQGYVAGTVTMDEELITPAVDASSSVGLVLSWDHAFDADYQPGDTARVYVFDGTDWIMIYESWTDDGYISSNNTQHKHKVYDVSAYANANFQAKFHYIEGSTVNRGQYFAIDNVRLRSSETGPIGWLTVDGSEFTNGVSMPDADNLPSPVEVIMNASGIAPGVYAADILVTSTDAGNPSTTVPVTLTVLPEVALDITVFLEGPYDAGTGSVMDHYLDTLGYLPLGQPYNPALPYYGNNTPAWLYGGTETVTAFPAATIDWVMVELRDAADAASAGSAAVIATQPAFLLDDGSVVGLDGSRLNFLNETVAQNLYVVIYHRNHLGVMSANAVTKTGDIYTYDYSTAETQVYGGNAGHKDLGAGVWGMVAADGDADGSVLPSDKTSVWLSDNNLTGYRGGDYSLNGVGQPDDVTNFWLPNGNSAGQIPGAKGAEVKGYQSQIPQ